MPKTIRNIDNDLFKKLKKRAQDMDLTVGEALNRAMVDWLNNNQDPEVDINDLEPLNLGEENLSENYEEELYG